jgi:hypothetical protein
LQRINRQQEAGLSRIITPESAAKERTQYQRAIILALRELMGQTGIDQSSYDLAAFIALMVEAIDASIDQSVAAWEKRGYWIKADRFRREWLWTVNLGGRIRTALADDNWDEVRAVAAQLITRLAKVKMPARHKLGTPWVGAWEKLSRS